MTDPIKTNPDGSIDTAHYIKIGRQARSDAAAAMFSRPARPACSARPGRPARHRGLSPVWVLLLVALVAVPGMMI